MGSLTGKHMYWSYRPEGLPNQVFSVGPNYGQSDTIYWIYDSEGHEWAAQAQHLTPHMCEDPDCPYCFPKPEFPG
jgi:hypothetical protein